MSSNKTFDFKNKTEGGRKDDDVEIDTSSSSSSSNRSIIYVDPDTGDVSIVPPEQIKHLNQLKEKSQTLVSKIKEFQNTMEPILNDLNKASKDVYYYKQLAIGQRHLIEIEKETNIQNEE